MKKWQELNQKTKIMVASGMVLGTLGLGGILESYFYKASLKRFRKIN